MAEASVAAVAAVTHSQPESAPATVDKEKEEIPAFLESQKDKVEPHFGFYLI